MPWRRLLATQPLTAPTIPLPSPLSPPLSGCGSATPNPLSPRCAAFGRQVCAPRLSAHSPCGVSGGETGGGGGGRAPRESEEVAVGSPARRRPGGRRWCLSGAHSLLQGWVLVQSGRCPARRPETELRIPFSCGPPD